MKTKLIASALIALTMAASGSAMAQRGDRDHDRNDHGDRGQQQYNNDRNDRHDGARGDDNNNRRNYDARNYRSDNYRGGGPRHDLRRGQRLSSEYRDNRYVVNDWRARRLSAPPRGQHWVQAGNDYVLAAIATGVITQILLSN
jgi:Ni/Co efflux regulator RcnB